MKNILITGGAGFIGSHLCRYFIKRGDRVFCMDNLITGNEKNIVDLKNNNNFNFIKHDICISFPDDIKKKMKQLDYILDLACPASPVDFPRYPLEILRVCSAGTENLLRLAVENQSLFLQTSTSEVYGDPEEHPQKETYWGHVNPYGTRSCYDEGKRYAEALIFNYRRKFKLNTKIMRIFNTYGPYMRPDDGRVVSNFVVQAIAGKPLTVYGDGLQTRSFCYISDMIEGIVKMVESNEEGPINLGNPDEFTILELANLVKKITTSKSEIVFKPLPKDDPKMRRPDISLAKKILGWEPKIMLKTGLGKTIEYFSKEKL